MNLSYPSYYSIEQFLAKLYRDFGIVSSDSINDHDFIEWIIEGSFLLNTAKLYQTRSHEAAVTDGKITLPCDVYKVISVSTENTVVIPDTTAGILSDYTYYINEPYLFTNVPEGTMLTITYKGIPVDEKGYPVLNADPEYIEALLYYVAYKIAFREFFRGNPQGQAYESLYQRFLLKQQKIKSMQLYPSDAEMELIKRVWIRLLPQQDVFVNQFRNLGGNTFTHRNPTSRGRKPSKRPADIL
jgi:hypothetical protein